MNASWEHVKVGDSSMRVYLSRPENARPAPAIIVVQGQTGVEDFVKFSDMAAARGFVAAAPDLYHRDPPDCKDDPPTRRLRLRDATIIQDLRAAVDFLKTHPAVESGKIGIVGFCMGGRIVQLMTAVNPDIKAGVMYYGADPFSAWGEGPSPYERIKDISCPIQGHFGEDDKNPSPADMRKLDAEMTRLGKPHEFYSYPNAAHAFANFGSGNYREHAAEASWPRTFSFFTKYLSAT